MANNDLLRNPDLLRLAAYRLEQDLSFEALAAAITASGYPIRARALHLILTNRVRTTPRDRTLYKIRQFLASRRTRKDVA